MLYLAHVYQGQTRSFLQFSWPPHTPAMNVHSSIIHSSQKGEKQPKCPLTDKGINKMWYIIQWILAKKRNYVLMHVLLHGQTVKTCYVKKARSESPALYPPSDTKHPERNTGAAWAEEEETER